MTQVAGGSVQLSLDHSFTYMHYGKYQGLPDGLEGYVDERAEVALLTRNILIFGTDEDGAYKLEGVMRHLSQEKGKKGRTLGCARIFKHWRKKKKKKK